eukprot:scaffold176308_cov30-Cyclotella_meneghiniana.AAC.1
MTTGSGDQENAGQMQGPTPNDVRQMGWENRRVTFTNSAGNIRQKRPAATSPSTLQSSLRSNRGSFQRQALASAQKSLTGRFESATYIALQVQLVCCEGVVCDGINAYTESSSVDVLKYLHKTMRISGGKCFALNCSGQKISSSVSPEDCAWSSSNGRLICPSCAKLKKHISSKAKKLAQLQQEYDDKQLRPLPLPSDLKAFVERVLLCKLGETKYGDEERSNIFALFRNDSNVMDCMFLLKRWNDSHIEVKVDKESFVVDCCHGDGCQEILARQGRKTNLPYCQQCHQKNLNNERSKKLKELNHDARVQPDSKVKMSALDEDE